MRAAILEHVPSVDAPISTTRVSGRVADAPRRRYGPGLPFVSSVRVDPDSLGCADRIYHVDQAGNRREGTVTRVYQVKETRRCNVLWDDPPADSLAPWRGASHGIHVEILQQPGWGVVMKRNSSGDWARARKILFPFGQLTATPGALDMLDNANVHPWVYLLQHVTGDWGDLDAEDIRVNEDAILFDARIFSAYTIRDGDRLWIITEADRSVTTLLLPSEY